MTGNRSNLSSAAFSVFLVCRVFFFLPLTSCNAYFSFQVLISASPPRNSPCFLQVPVFIKQLGTNQTK